MSEDWMKVRPFEGENIPANRRTCLLMVTHGCNLNCTYCYEKFKNPSKKMDVNLAKKLILKEIDTVRNTESYGELEINFMGGEPLLRYDLIKEIVEWLEEAAVDVPYVCFATTNGTLLNDERKAWFEAHKHTMVLGVSYDGITGAQRTNRGDKAGSIDADFFARTWPEQVFKMTISKESLPYLYESFVDVVEKGYYVNASLAQGVAWTKDDALEYRKQLSRLRQFYLDNPKITPCNLLTRSLAGIESGVVAQTKFCGSGDGMITYDVDGTAYGCHMFTPLVLNERALPLDSGAACTGRENITDALCKGCIFANWCPTCIGFNMKDRGAAHNRDHRWCHMVAVQAVEACMFQLECLDRLASYRELDEKEAVQLKFALKAYDTLKNINPEGAFPQ